MIQFLLLFPILKNVEGRCNFQSFDEAQLDTNNFYGEKSFTIGYQYAFGFWIMYAPMRQNYHLSYSKPYFEDLASNDGFHLFNFQINDQIQTLVVHDAAPSYYYFGEFIFITFYIQTYYGVFMYQFPFDFSRYEGYWMFLYCAYYNQELYEFITFNTWDENFQNGVGNFPFPKDSSNAKLEFGGEGQYYIGGAEANLNIFPGRISKPIIFDNVLFFNWWDTYYFLYYLSNLNCQMPPRCQEEFSVNVFDQVYNVSNISVSQYVVEIRGDMDCIDFWMKREILQEQYFDEFILTLGMTYQGSFKNRIRITGIAFEDKILIANQFQAYQKYPNNQITTVGYYQLPIKQLFSWCYFRYDFIRTNQGQYVIVKIYAAEENIFYQEILFSYQESYYYSNVKGVLSLFTNVNELEPAIQQAFSGYIANLRMIYCVKEFISIGDNSDFSIYQCNLDCHKLCKKCKGPTQWDCTSCYPEQNRFLQSGMNICKCLQNYQEVDGQLNCELKIRSVSKISQLKELNYVKCPYGYFLNDQICIKCPYLHQKQIQCLNCLLNSEQWSLNPICDQDYETDGNFYTLFYNEDQQIFKINTNLLTVDICNGCKTQNSCLKNRFYKNGDCITCCLNCANCDKEFCIECENGYYLQDRQCYSCPMACTDCQSNQFGIQCVSCMSQFTLVNNICQKCGLNCEECEVRTYNNQNYLKCLQCQPDTYLSLDGVSCFYNTMKYCIVPFQFSNQDLKINTIFYDFQPQPIEKIQTGCTQCNVQAYLVLDNNNFQCFTPPEAIYKPGCYFWVQYNGSDDCQLAPILKDNYGYCYHDYPYCQFCLQLTNEIIKYCLACQKGYYNDYYTSFCIACPEQCSACYQSDFSKIKKILQLKSINLILNLGYFEFLELTQEPDSKNIKIYCTECRVGYNLYDNICQINCPSNCRECRYVNNLPVCISCLELDEYSHLTIENGQCIACPTNCKLCKTRTIQQQEKFNPYFQNLDYALFSNQCVVPIDESQYYDQELKQFVNCKKCEKYVDFEIGVGCTSNFVEDKFNIKIGKLFNSNSLNYLSDIETIEYYLYLNTEYVKQINYKFHLEPNSICSLEDINYFASTLQQNVFNLRQINFQLEGNNSTIIGNITLSNFSSIRIQNLKILNGAIITRNIQSYQIQFENITVSGSSSETEIKWSNFQFNQATSVLLKGIEVLNMKYNKLASLMQVNSSDFIVKLECDTIHIEKSVFSGTQIFYISALESTAIFRNIHLFRNIIIQSQFLFGLSQLNFKNINIINSQLNDVSNFFLLTDFAIFDQLNISYSSLSHSQLIKTQNGLEISNSFFSKLQIYGNSTLVSLVSFLKDSSIIVINTIFIDIAYEENQAIMIVQNTEAQVILNHVHLINIFLEQNFLLWNYQPSIKQSLFYFDCSVIFFENVNIERGLGYPEFSILNVINFTLSNSNISLNDKYQFKSISTSSNCTTVEKRNFYFRTFMYFNNVLEGNFKNVSFLNLIIYDSALIDYKQAAQLNNSLISMVGCKFISNIVHQTQTDSRVSLLKIESLAGLQVYVENDLFSLNLLSITTSKSTTNEGLLFSVISSSCSIKNSVFDSNMIINGQSSIFQMDSNELIIENSIFSRNSIFVFETLKQFLIWGFQKEVFQEDLEVLFPSKSLGGNGNLKASKLSIINSKIEKSHSKFGGAFSITLLENGYLYVYNSSFQYLTVDMSDNSQGGCLYIISNAQVLNLEIIQSTFQFISARESGGLVYLQTSAISPQLNFVDSIFSNIFAIQGSLVYISQQGNPNLKIKNCQIRVQDQLLQSFLNNILEITNLEITILTQYFSVIYFTDGLIRIQNLTITEYPLLQFLYSQNSVHLQDLKFLNIQFARPLLTFNTNANTMKIQVDSLTLINCTKAEKFTINSLPTLKSQSVTSFCNSYEMPNSITLAGYSSGSYNYQTLVQMLVDKSIQSVISFNDFKDTDIISIKSLFIQVVCKNCQFGVIGFLNLQKTIIYITSLHISNSECGSLGCLHINSGNNRLLEQVINIRNNIQIKDLICTGNQAQYGGCIYLKNQKISILESQIINNSAIFGGAIYISGSESILDSQQLSIINNNATEGSGVYSTDNYLSQQNGILYFDNMGQTIFSKPSQLQIQFFVDQIITPKITYMDQYHVETEVLSQNGLEATVYMPTGVQISKYRRFSMKTNQYTNDYQILRLYALTDTLETANLQGTYCNCWVIDENGIKQQNLTNKNTFQYQKDFYDLSSLILYIPQDQSQKFWLQFWCSSVYSPVVKENQIIQFHQNYTLQVRIKPYQCQLGEYHKGEQDYCHQCLIDLKQYSTTENSSFCETQNDIFINDFTPAQIKLNKGYWRYQITSSTIDICYNNQGNCVGGWDVGNDLCMQGFIGALCEQCDAFDIRGHGSYYLSKQFECLPCKNTYFSSVAQVLGSTIAFLIFLAFFSQLQQSGQLMSASLQFTRLQQIQLKESIQLQYIKQIIQFFQIVSLSAELSLIYDTGLQIFIDILGNSFQMNIINFCYFTGSHFQIVYFDILQNFCVLLTILTVILIFFILLHYLDIVKLSKQRILDYSYLVYLFYGCSIMRSVLKLISFRRIQDLTWIYQNIAYNYNTSTHLKLVFGLFIPFLIIFCFLVCLILFVNGRKMNKQTSIRLGVWYQAFKDCQQESFKVMTLFLINIGIIFVDGDYSLRCLMAFSVLTFYYQHTYSNLPYCSNQQNLSEIRFILFSLSIMVLNVFHRVVTLTVIQDIIQTFSYLLISFSFLLIIQGLLKSQIIPVQKMMRLFVRWLIKLFPFLFNINFFYKYSEQAEKEKNRRFELLKSYLLTAGRQSLELKRK